MWRLRLDDTQSAASSPRLQQQQSAETCDDRRRDDRIVRRRVSLGDVATSSPLISEGPSRLLESLFCRLVASYSRSLAFLAPLNTPDQLSSCSCAPRHLSLDDEVDWTILSSYITLSPCYYNSERCFSLCQHSLHRQTLLLVGSHAAPPPSGTVFPHMLCALLTVSLVLGLSSRMFARHL